MSPILLNCCEDLLFHYRKCFAHIYSGYRKELPSFRIITLCCFAAETKTQLFLYSATFNHCNLAWSESRPQKFCKEEWVYTAVSGGAVGRDISQQTKDCN